MTSWMTPIWWHASKLNHRGSNGAVTDHKINRLDELLPWNWVPLASVSDSQAA